nr:MAG TPA: GTP cyclohydrolase I [Caudoviricetes sp.]
MYNENAYKKLTTAYGMILDVLRESTNDPDARENFTGSEDRCARALMETCKTDDEIVEALSHIVDRQFPMSSNAVDVRNVMSINNPGIICQGPITVNSSCPHHLYPVRYEAYVAYIPKDGRVLGLSKLARIAKILGKRPVLQEQLAADIADVLCAPMTDNGNMDGSLERLPFRFPALESEGSAVLLVGVHNCMCQRGVEENARTMVCELRGSFLNEGMEQKFYSLIKSGRVGTPY